jgi:hypothetical protein
VRYWQREWCTQRVARLDALASAYHFGVLVSLYEQLADRFAVPLAVDVHVDSDVTEPERERQCNAFAELFGYA